MSVAAQGVDEAPRPLRTLYVTGNYFTTLGVGAFTGRVFTAADDARRRAAGRDDGVSRMAGSLRWRRLHRRIDAHHRRPSRSLLPASPRPDSSARPCAPTRRTSGCRCNTSRSFPAPNVAAAPADFGLAARDRPAARWRDDRRHGRAAHGAAAQLDADRGRLSGQLDAGNRTHAAGADDHGGAGGRRRRRHEGAVRAKPAHSDGGVRPGAADRLRQRRQPAAGSRGRTARPDRRATGHGRIARTDRHRSARSNASCWPSAARSPGSWSRPVRLGSCCRSRLPARRCCRSTRCRRRWCWPLPLAWR